MEGFNFIKVRYLGEKYVLLSGKSEGVAKKTYDKNKD